jgi:hypothetical protein
MNNEEFKNIVNDLLKPLGFKKKGNYWKLETEEIEKIIDLQKSNFSNLYYLNYGYNLKNLNYDTVRKHIYNRLPQHSAFDLENNLIPAIRNEEIQKIFNNELIPEVSRINTESDIIELLKKRPHLNEIPLKVKEYLKLK